MEAEAANSPDQRVTREGGQGMPRVTVWVGTGGVGGILLAGAIAIFGVMPSSVDSDVASGGAAAWSLIAACLAAWQVWALHKSPVATRSALSAAARLLLLFGSTGPLLYLSFASMDIAIAHVDPDGIGSPRPGADFVVALCAGALICLIVGAALFLVAGVRQCRRTRRQHLA